MIHNMKSGLTKYFQWKMLFFGIAISLLLILMLLTSCASIQTTPTCQGTEYVSGYGVVDIINHTDRYHVGAYCKLVSPTTCGEVITFGIATGSPPTRLRFTPGNYQLSIKILLGYEYVIKTYEFYVGVCEDDIVFELK